MAELIATRRVPAALGRVPELAVNASIIVAIAVLAWILLRPSPDPDSYWALIWGRDVLEGQAPHVNVAGAPLAHPLGVGVGAVVGLAGRTGAVALFNALVVLSLGATLVGMFRLGQVIFGTPAAWVAAAAAALCSFTLASVVLFSSLDVTAYALAVWAVLLIAKSPQKAVVPLVLLGLAGLQRPEVWMLSAAYWLYLVATLDDRRRTARLALLAAAPVICWIAFDLVVANSFDHSLSEIQEVGEVVPEGRWAAVQKQLAGAIPPAFPVLLIPVALLGMALSFWMRVRGAMLPAAVAFLGLLAVGVYFVAGIIVVGRFVVIPSLMTMLFVGYAVMGGIGRPGRWGRAWRVASIVAGVIVVIAAVRQVNGVRETREVLADDARASTAEFIRLTRQPPVATVLDRCAPVWTQSQNPATYYFSGVDAAEFRLARSVPATGLVGKVPDRGVLIGGLSAPGLAKPADSYRLVVPPGFSRVSAHGRWTVYERGC